MRERGREWERERERERESGREDEEQRERVGERESEREDEGQRERVGESEKKKAEGRSILRSTDNSITALFTNISHKAENFQKESQKPRKIKLLKLKPSGTFFNLWSHFHNRSIRSNN